MRNHCLYLQAVELIRFRYFVTTVLSPDMPVVILCIVLVLAAYSAALYGVESLARAAAIAAVLIAAVIAFIAFALMPEMDAAYSRRFCTMAFAGYRRLAGGDAEDDGNCGARPNAAALSGKGLSAQP